MAPVLAIETAAPAPVVALGEEGRLLFEARPSGRVEAPVYLAAMVEEACRAAGIRRRRIGHVAVDRGPGGLMATRSGVAFANAFAYGLERPLVALDYFDLVGAESWALHGLPVLCVRETAAGQAFTARFDGDGLTGFGFGALEERCRLAGADLAALTLAGTVGARGQALLAGRCRRGVAVPAGATLLARAARRIAQGEARREPLEALATPPPAAGAP